ncbi:MAG: TonB-dependent receptor, partial [Betaproteobacteria bacterium]|nr:TonB-dependent receptor [Betaproteobacteria bacterium]
MKPPTNPRLLPALLASIFTLPAVADNTGGTAMGRDEGIFTLGQITVAGQREDASSIGTTTIDREDMWDFSRNGLPEALNLVPGVFTTLGSG